MPPADAVDDPVTRIRDQAVQLVRRRPTDDEVDALLVGLDDLRERELVRFDERSRSWRSGSAPGDRESAVALAGRRVEPALVGDGARLGDGFERQHAIEEVQLRLSTLR